MTDQERRQELIEIWTGTDEVAKAIEENLPEDNSIAQMVISGAGGN
jgi:DNA-directed RNA polymerase subunit beta'